MPYNETDPITTQDVIDQIHKKNFDGARDSISNLLYKKSADAVAYKKVDIAKKIGRPDVGEPVIDMSEPVEPIDIPVDTNTNEE